MQMEAAVPWKPIQSQERYTVANRIDRLSTAIQKWNDLVQREGRELVIERTFRLFGIETCQIEKVFTLRKPSKELVLRYYTF